MSDRLQKLMSFYEADPMDDFVVFALAQEQEKLEDDAKAQHYYELVINRNEKYIGVYYHLGKLHQRQERMEKAMEVFEKGIKISMEIKDLHALAELKNAKTNLEMEMI